MKKVRIFWLHPEISSVELIRNALNYDERQYGFEFICDDERPEYLIISEMIYFRWEYQEKFLHYFKNNPIVIAFPGEFIVPDMNFTDYAIVWDRNLRMNDRIFRKPTMLYYNKLKKWQNNAQRQSLKTVTDRKFCSFIYSNGNAHPFRDQLFYALNQYKQVESLGRHLNNVGNIPGRDNKDWRTQSIELKSNYKFNISCNNHYFAGGIDEKLLTSFAAGSVPIFWGDPTVEEEFNPKAMINCHNYEGMDKIVEAVKMVDQDDELWHEMISQPWQTDEQKQMTEIETIKYKEFLTHIFMQNKKEAKRAGEGTWRDFYMRWFEHDDKFRLYFHDLVCWINIKNANKRLDDYLDEKGYHVVAIYGFGDVGRCLYNELKNSKIIVKYAIDQNAAQIKAEIHVYDFSDNWEEVDAVIVTPTPFYENIRIQINKKYSYPIISLKNMLDDIILNNDNG